ncbi:hypothetical protein [Rhodocyclus purpureus]|uniref:hypothetical protein n=1 Tax=Rhodocyclus purpureus TaxID=1067 RepID=UPI001913D35C|nr:hypothetical protein [Rhodocyclus purpureus]
MAITTVVQRGYHVYVYDEKSRQTAIIPVGNGPNEGLMGYTHSVTHNSFSMNRA